MTVFRFVSIAAVCALAFALACAPVKQQQTETLLDRLKAAADGGKYMYAHQDDLAYGHLRTGACTDSLYRGDVSEVCGDYPAIVGFDLGGIELGDKANLDGVDFDLMRAQASAFVQAGGIVTFSWHLRNPLTGGDAWDITSDQVVKSVLEGGECHELFKTWLCRLADFLESIKDADGQPIPCIFRPWHENTGSWFWWGEDLCTDEEYMALWRLTYDYVAVERGLDNYVWAYSPGSTLITKAMDRYPGDDIIDLIGVDCYDHSEDAEVHQDFIANVRSSLEWLAPIASEHGLLLALTETGQESLPCATWWTEALQPALEGFPVSYVLTWRNASDRPTHFYAPWAGFAGSEDFLSFYNSDKTLFLKDIASK